MELFVMKLDSGDNVVHKILKDDEVKKVLDEVEAEAATAGDS